MNPSEVRLFYGMYMDDWNLFMPIEHFIYIFHEQIMNTVKWRGAGCSKNVLDAWVYQEIIHETKPDIIIEIGTERGGSALFLHDVLNMNKAASGDILGSVISIDLDHSKVQFDKRKYPLIKLIEGNALSEEIYQKVCAWVRATERLMVIDDASHEYEDVLSALERYGNLVTPGCYFIVEDTILNHGLIHTRFQGRKGPMEAVDHFMANDDRFIMDRSREKFFLTNNPKGFLKRVK